MRRFLRSTSSIAELLLFCALGYAQTDGIITGRVVDTSGAIVVGAAITVTQTDTNFESQTVTNAEGLYRVQSLRSGPYRVTVSAPGFQRLVRDGLSLRTGETQAIDCVLNIGSALQTI